MRLLKFDVSGWAGVDRITIVNPPERVLEVWSTDNGQGKSSLLEPLLALAGGKARIVDGLSAVRDGRKRARAEIEWEHCGATYRAALSVSAKSGTLTIDLTGADGTAVAKPREALSGFFGRLYSPSDFCSWTTDQQVAFARGLAGDEWSAEYDRLRAAAADAEADRLLAGRALRAMGAVAPVDPAEPVDVDAIVAELKIAERVNAEADAVVAAWRNEQSSRAARAIRLRDNVTSARRAVDRLRDELAAAEADLAAQESALAATPPTEDVEPSPERRDTEALRTSLSAAARRNEAAQRYRQYLAAQKRVDAAKTAHAESEAAVEAARGAVASHIQGAPLPAGLTIAASGVEWQGRPLARASTGEGYRLGFELARAANQRLVVHDRAESMDAQVVADLEQWCREADMVAVLATMGRAHTPGAVELRNGRVVDDTTDDGGAE